MPSSKMVKTVLSIAGSDSGGGAGIQADLKAFARCRVHGTTAITAITAQNTVGVAAVEHISPGLIVAQVKAVVDDIGIDAVKIGMLGCAETVRAVAEALKLVNPEVPVVVDPVMVSESGAELLDPAARSLLVDLILARATVVTPNLAEASVLAGEASNPAAGALAEEKLVALELVKKVHVLGAQFTVLTGGHRELATDIFYDGQSPVEIPGERYPDGAAHGSGCTHSSALAAHLALGYPPLQAAQRAKAIAAQAVKEGLCSVGQGAGPVDVFGLTTSTGKVLQTEGR